MAQKPKLGFHIILLGMIASGKNTQSKILAETYALKFVETGRFSRLLMRAKTKDGDLFRRIVGRGLPAPIRFIKKFISDEIEKKPRNKDLLFVGGPRLKPEAQLLKKLLTSKKQNFHAFYISLRDEEVYKRSLERKAGTVNPLYKVLDEKKLITERIRWHKDQVSKTVDYFESIGKMKKINGNQNMRQVAEDIQKTITSLKNITHE